MITKALERHSYQQKESRGIYGISHALLHFFPAFFAEDAQFRLFILEREELILQKSSTICTISELSVEGFDTDL